LSFRASRLIKSAQATILVDTVQELMVLLEGVSPVCMRSYAVCILMVLLEGVCPVCMCSYAVCILMVLLEGVCPVCMCSYAVCILIEDTPLCFNSHNKTNSLFSQKYYIIIGILLCHHVSIFL
jgi:hypothetical protein